MPEAHPREFRDDVVAVARLGDAPVGPMPFKPSSPVSVSMEDLDQLFVGLPLASVDPLEIYDEFHRDSFAGLPSRVPRTNACPDSAHGSAAGRR